jgi:hypothetical protein
MRVLLFANNRVGASVAEWLSSEGEEIVGVLWHPPDRRRFGEERTSPRLFGTWVPKSACRSSSDIGFRSESSICCRGVV